MKNLFAKVVTAIAAGIFISSMSLSAATVTWVGGSGDWTNKANWSTGALPGVSDNVVISPAATITVTHSAGAHTVNSIQSAKAFVLSGGSLIVSTTFIASNTFTLSGGTLQSATVITTNGGSFVVQSGTLNGVTVDGVLDVGNTYGGADLGVLNGLVLNGTALVGNPTNSLVGGINFSGTQSLTGNGTVVFGSYPYNALWLPNAGTTLTIGGGITVEGQNGTIGYSPNYFGGSPNVTVINQGTISADVVNGTITVNAQPFTNQGLAQAINGGTLLLNSTWSNSGTLVESGGTINFGGGFTLASVGTLNRTNGTVYISGTLTNTSTTLTLSAVSGLWVLNGGTILGGTILTTNGGSFVVQSGTLNGVTVDGVLDVGNTYGGADLGVLNGLVLNGTALVGNPTNSLVGGINFSGTQSLTGNGTVVFGSYPYNALWLPNAGTTLTIGGGITVEGQNGTIGYSPNYFGGSPNVTVINQGTISADVVNGTITVNAQPFTNQGLAQAINGGTLLLNSTWSNSGTLVESGGTINFGGGFTLASVGTLNRTNGTVYISGTLTNTSTTLTLSAVSGLWVLNGGTILGGTILTTNGGSFVVQSGTLNGVTVDGVLDVGNTYGGADLGVLNGLVLNGTALVGNPTNSLVGGINFSGTQSLTGNGTVVFGSYPYNALWLPNAGTTLTIGGGITVEGQNGTIGYSPNYFGGSPNVTVINQGTISADVVNGTITVNAQPFTNQGLAQAINGGTLLLNSTWSNSGTLVESGGTINFGGGFTLASVGTLNRTNGTVYISGTLTNTSTTLTLSAVSGLWVLNGGTILGGTILTTNGGSFVVQSGTLNGVTVDGVLDVGNTYGGADLGVLNGLVLNGTALVGNPTNSLVGGINFSGTQSLTGNGTVVFGSYPYNALWLPNAGTTLTIGGGITVEGQNGTIGYSPNYFGGSPNVTVINQGTISADVVNGTITVNAQPLQNLGGVQAINGGTLQLLQTPSSAGNIFVSSGGIVKLAGSIFLNGLDTLISQSGSTFQISGSLLGNTKNLGQYSALGTTVFNGSGTASSPQLLEVMGEDYGASQLGFIHNFDYGTVTLANNTYVQLVNQYQNSSSTAQEALYVNSLVVPAGTTLNMNGLHVYARATQIGGTILNGTVEQIPNSGPIGFSSPSLGDISTAGQLDQWTFFARSGQLYTVLVDPGSDIGVSPPLDFVQVQVLNTNGLLMASATNSAKGIGVILSSIAITNDGTYSVQVHASPVSPSGTGHYEVTVWQTTPNIYPLTLNTIVSGSILTPYSVDQWTFGAATNTQVRFHLVNLSGTGAGFDLDGPNGWKGFTNLTADSGFITLPTAGNYYLAAHSLNGQYGAIYAFELFGTAVTNLSLGTQFQGQFTTTGQGQLFEFNVTSSEPLQVVLNNLVTNNHAVVYAQFGQPPTPSSYAYSATVPTGPSQQLLVPVAQAGTWYVLVYGDNIQTPGVYTVTASSYSVILNSLTPNISGLNQPFTVALMGAGFDSSTSVQFIDASNNVHQASSVLADSFTQVTVNENSGMLDPGMYSVRVSLASGSSATLTNAFQVLTYGIPNLVTSLSLPAEMGYHIPSTIYPNYGNTGGAAMAAPLLVLTPTQNGNLGAFMTLDGTLVAQGLWTSADPAGFSHSVQFLGSGQTPGLLEPGESVRMPVYYAGWQQPWNFSYPPINWNLDVIQTTDTTPINWASLETNMQPASIPPDAWNAIFSAFTNEVGSTWGAYVSMLDNNSYYLGQLGLNVTDISKLLAFQIVQADGLCPLRSLASSVDASVPTPGLPLTFSRSFGEPISQRYAFGPLGRGWSHNWQYTLQQGSDGTVTIFGPGGSQRVFQPNTQNGGYWAQAGDYGILASAGGGAFTLTEKTGLLYYYSANGTLGYLQDPNGNTVTLVYTGSRLTKLTHSSGQYIQIGYNSAGLIQTITDNFGHQTVLTYDTANQHLASAQYFDGRTAAYVYNTTGNAAQLHSLAAVASSCCNWRYFNYDAYGRLTGTYLENNAEALIFTYGSSVLYQPLIGNSASLPFSGGLCTVTDGFGNPTQFFFDNNGLLAKTVDALGNAVHLSFDSNYNLTSIMDPAGRSYDYSYDAEGNVIQSTDPLGNNSQFSYTGAYNRLASVTDAKGNRTHYAYDPYGNLDSITYADGSVESWSYDDLGDPQTWNNRRDHQTFYTFNNNGQVTGKYFADGSATLYSYDTKANLTNSTTYDIYLNPLESVNMYYDTSNHLAQMLYPGGKFLDFSYDSNGRRLSSVDQLGHTLNYTYDLAGRLQSMTNELNAPVVLYQYDLAGRIAVKTLGSGIFTTYQYDPAGQLLDLTNFLGNGAVVSSFNYSYDSRGRRLTMNTLDGNWTYIYDDIGQLTHAVYAAVTTNVPNQNLIYIYDSLGNRSISIENGVTNSYAVNSLNQYFSVGQTNYTFDSDGNLIREVSPQGTTTYTYSDENRLTAMTSLQGTWSYSYDGLGDRVGTVTNGIATQFVIDPIGLGNIVGEYNGNGNLVAHYDHALGLLARIDSSANSYGYTFDAIGNVRQMVSSGGVIANNYAYTPFGHILRNIITVPNPFQFNGQYGVTTESSGLNFMRDRFYSQGIGKFESQDLLGEAGGDIDLYRFSHNNPASRIDPNGASDVEPFWWYWKWVSKQTWLYRMGDTGRYFLNESKLAPIPYNVSFSYVSDWGQFLEGLPAYLWIWDNVFYGTLSGDDEISPTDDQDYSEDPYQGPPLDFITGNGGNFPGGYDPTSPGYTTPNPCSDGNCGNGGGGSTTTTGTQDPNQLIGPAGYGASGFVVSSNLLAYRIDFENSSNAAAAAQQVNITDQLSTNYDWTRFNVSEVGFGNLIISLPPGVAAFNTNLPYSYLGTNFQVQIQIGIQPNSGEVYANFQSIDPTTSLPPPVNIGFLPPENGTGIGMGHVTYTIHAKTGLPNATELNNVALISFNEQPSIATDQVNDENPAAGISTSLEAMITLDSIPPTSYVLPLALQSQFLQVPVSWTGQDNTYGPGIASYNIYVSDNGGPWTIWQSATTATNATFQGKPQHTYGFTSQATDNAGLVEAQHTTADAATTIIANPQFQLTVTPASTNLTTDSTFSYTITVKNIGTLTLDNVVMSNTMPAGIDLDWVQYGLGSCTIEDPSVIWSLGNMNTNASASMNVTAEAVANGIWTNAFTVADSAGAASSSATSLIYIGVTPAVFLNISLTNNQVQLSWPLSAGNFGLQVTTNLGPSSVWGIVSGASVTNGNIIILTFPVTKTNQFFRLEGQ